ncbi:hypothetical protein LTR10_012347 [Elasticomyces elasticus]|nr:hypothetical protein LTR10_012347 [Elasticomyces elasticus]KAK4965822.1 hypothetical protein LTR42_011836 [Elasticomyces elasticus]
MTSRPHIASASYFLDGQKDSDIPKNTINMPTNLLALPTELLDRIASYLDWDRAGSLVPRRPDIHSISETCKHLRAATLPLLFRNVTLSLRWQDGVLLEPSLYQLKRERPDLAQHVRSVYVATRLGFRPGTRLGQEAPDFRIPDDVEDWLGTEKAGDGSGDARFHSELDEMHRNRLDDVVDRLYANLNDAPVGTATPSEASSANALSSSLEASAALLLLAGKDVAGNNTAESKIRHLIRHANFTIKQNRPAKKALPTNAVRRDSWEGTWGTLIGATHLSNNSYASRFDPYHGAGPSLRKAQRTKLQIDALATLMLCLPPTVNEIVYEPGASQAEQPWFHFSAYLLDHMLQVFGHRIESLTTATSEGRTQRIHRLVNPVSDNEPISSAPDGLQHLTNLRRLVLASTSATPEAGFSGPQVQILQMSGTDYINRWSTPTLHTTLTTIEFWNTVLTDTNFTYLATFITPFRNLKVLNFQHVQYNTQGVPSRIYPINNQHLGEGVLLSFAIALRRALPTNTKIRFHDISCTTRGPQQRVEIPKSALEWIMREAVPSNQPELDFQREERLLEDFESFQFLWEAEDGERGNEAGRHRKEVDLVDSAMCSRWKQFENVRRDQGEWETL